MVRNARLYGVWFYKAWKAFNCIVYPLYFIAYKLHKVNNKLWILFAQFILAIVFFLQHFYLFYRFWYVSLAACYRNTSGDCEFHHIKEEAELEYDIWLVNGQPNGTSHNPIIYQFSFDRQVGYNFDNLLTLYLRLCM